MVFSSTIFLFLYLPIFLFLYHLILIPVWSSRSTSLQKRFRKISNLFLFVSSLLFYFWGENWLIFAMLTSTVLDYTCGRLINRNRERSNKKDAYQRSNKCILIFSLVANLLLLCVFKYFNFGIENFNAVIQLMGLNSLHIEGVAKIALPLGISFYTFQSMSYTIDVYRGEVKPATNFIDFAAYVTMFPQLVAGPIVRYRDVAEELIGRSISRESFASGVNRFIVGLGKKVLIANSVAIPADEIFSLSTTNLTPSLAWFGILCYTLQIYFDFSGYSDMAIGIGRMLGFHFPENFNYPYMSKSIQEFWRRWHISLSTWFKDYLYIPLGGNQRPPLRVYFNLLVVFSLCGLWHGASWTFVVWGLFHGAFLILERFCLRRWLRHQFDFIQHVYAIFVFMCGWVLFRSETFSQAMDYYLVMAGFYESTSPSYSLSIYFTGFTPVSLLLGCMFSFPIYPWIRNKYILFTKKNFAAHFVYEGVKFCFIMFVLSLCCLTLSSGTYNPFIYFRF